MDFSEYFPIWGQLTPDEQERLSQGTALRQIPKGTVLHNGSEDCRGPLIVRSGQLRAYILSQEGREVTLYRLFDRDMCLFSAPCMLQSIQFDITIAAEKDTELWIISPQVYRELMENCTAIANYTNQIMASRFSEVMWLIEQIMWKSFDKRLASFLLEEMALEGTASLRLTHETISNHLGTAREVVTRMLRHFQGEGWVRLTRGTVEVTDEQALRQLEDN